MTEKEDKTRVTEAQVKEVLSADKGSDAQLKSWRIRNFTQKGDNFATQVTSLEVTYSHHQGREHESIPCHQGNENKIVSYIVKVNPGRDFIPGVQQFNSALFQKEVGFFEALAKPLNVEMVALGLEELRIPKCFYTNMACNNETVILEDLRVRGFKMFDKKKGLDPAHTRLVVQELARLHAASLLLHSKMKVDWTDAHDFLNLDWSRFADFSKEFFNNWFQGGLMLAEQMLEKVGGHEESKKWVERYKNTSSDLFEGHLRRISPFVVLCHGDCWNNNILFRYSDNGEPLEVMLLDLQHCRVASPATDLSYLFYTSMFAHVRTHSLDDFLASYYQAFTEVLQTAHIPAPFTLEELRREYQSKREYGLLFGNNLLSVTMGDDNDMPDLDNMKPEDMPRLMEEFIQRNMMKLDTDPAFRSRFLGLFQFLEEGK